MVMDETPGAEVSFDGATMIVSVWETLLPESERPWFRFVIDGVAFKGQALEPPVALPDGRVRYTVRMERE
jgi:hypothetical protein